jgi:hypothetical protein
MNRLYDSLQGGRSSKVQRRRGWRAGSHHYTEKTFFGFGTPGY